jgi:hypothetical protein
MEKNGVLEKSMGFLMERIHFHLKNRFPSIEAAIFSSKYGSLCETGNFNEYIRRLEK